jgi:hypothetical protein
MKIYFAVMAFLILFFCYGGIIIHGESISALYSEVISLKESSSFQKRALLIIARDIKVKNDLIEKQKEFIKTLEEDNKMLYQELFKANENVRKHSVKHELYGDAKAQKAF